MRGVANEIHKDVLVLEDGVLEVANEVHEAREELVTFTVEGRKAEVEKVEGFGYCSCRCTQAVSAEGEAGFAGSAESKCAGEPRYGVD